MLTRESSGAVFVVVVFLLMAAKAISDFRLPKNVYPLHYDLRMQPILDDVPGYKRFTCPGQLRIVLGCEKNTKEVALHALENHIDIRRVKIVDRSSLKELDIVNTYFEHSRNFFYIELMHNLTKGGTYDLFIDFFSQISQEELQGLYLDNYMDTDTGETRYIATTLFATTGARRAFPLFDEPEFKATFQVTIGRNENYTSLSNTQVMSTKPHRELKGWVWDKFEKTPLIAPYVVCFIVCDYPFAKAVEEDTDLDIRVYADKNLINRGGGEFSTKLIPKILSRYEDYLQRKYELSKMFTIALPHFFYSAMENIGMVTFTETSLIYVENETSQTQKMNLINTLSHEMAHQWFGNLVTCKWWAWLWLNEGFATYMAYNQLETLAPEFRVGDQFIEGVVHKGLRFDARESTHPVQAKLNKIEDLYKIYDRITYEKAASLLNMLKDIVGEKKFRKALINYIHDYQHSNAEQIDLFNEVQKQVDAKGLRLPASIAEIMETWTLQPGFPLLKVSIANSKNIIITQRGYSTKTKHQRWYVPIRIRIGMKNRLYFILPDSKPLQIPIPPNENFFIDPDSIGFFRIKYGYSLFKQVLRNPTSLTPRMKATIIETQKEFAISGSGMFTTFMKTFTLLDPSFHPLVWRVGMKYMSAFIRSYVSEKAIPIILNSNISRRAEGLFKARHSNSTGYELMALSSVLNFLCLVNSPACVDYAKSYAELVKKTKQFSSVLPDFQGELLCKALEEETDMELSSIILERLKIAGTTSNYRMTLLAPLICVKNQTNLETLASELINEVLFSNRLSVTESRRIEIFKYAVNRKERNTIVLAFIEKFVKGLKTPMSKSAKSRLRKLVNFFILGATSENVISQARTIASRLGISAANSVKSAKRTLRRKKKVGGTIAAIIKKLH